MTSRPPIMPSPSNTLDQQHRASDGTPQRRLQNVLLLSAGRRVELLHGFQTATARLVNPAQVFAADMRPALSAACQSAAYHFAVPAVNDPTYISVLLDRCQQHSIGLVVPTIDTELQLLAAHRAQFAEQGTYVVVSDLGLVDACRDKRSTQALLAKVGIASPKLYSRDDIQFPCFTKFYDGSNSVGAMKLQHRSQLTESLLSDPKRIFMEWVSSEYQETTVDLYYDRHSTLKAIVPRQRIEVRGGEVSKGVTRRGWLYEFLKQRLDVLSGARGCMTLQVFSDDRTQDVKGIEINPRFGGGFPLSLAAGADFPAWLIQEYLLEQTLPFYDDWEPDLMMLRYDAKVLVNDYK